MITPFEKVCCKKVDSLDVLYRTWSLLSGETKKELSLFITTRVRGSSSKSGVGFSKWGLEPVRLSVSFSC